MNKAKIKTVSYRAVVLLLRAALVAVLLTAGWMVYKTLPHGAVADSTPDTGLTLVQIVLRRDERTRTMAVDVPVELYPIDIVAVQHEFFAERRAGERFDDFLKQRMKGRSPVNARFDTQGQTTVPVPPGAWWIHATIRGDEELEWHLPVRIGGRNQLVELTPQNAYSRTKSF